MSDPAQAPFEALSEPEKLERLQNYADAFNQSATLGLLGVRVEFPDTQHVHAIIDEVQPGHRGGLGTDAINGGVLAALFDLVIGVSAALVDPTRRAATIQLSMQFERPVTGTRVLAEAWLNRAGSTNLFAGALIRGEDGHACAHAQGVVRISRSQWQYPGSPAVN